MDQMEPLQALRLAGQELYGVSWREPLARVLKRPGAPDVGVSWRLLRYWLDGDRPPPAWLLPELGRVLRAEAEFRHVRLLALAGQIETAARPE